MSDPFERELRPATGTPSKRKTSLVHVFISLMGVQQAAAALKACGGFKASVLWGRRTSPCGTGSAWQPVGLGVRARSEAAQLPFHFWFEGIRRASGTRGTKEPQVLSTQILMKQEENSGRKTMKLEKEIQPPSVLLKNCKILDSSTCTGLF